MPKDAAEPTRGENGTFGDDAMGALFVAIKDVRTKTAHSLIGVEWIP